MNPQGWIALGALALAGLGFVLGLFKYFTGAINNLRIEQENKLSEEAKDCEAKLAEAIKQGDDKRARMYERLDDIKKTHKEEIEKLHKEFIDSFVHSKVCELLRQNTTTTIDKIEKTLEDILEKIDRINEKLNDGKE